MFPLVKHETTVLAEVQKQMKKLFSTNIMLPLHTKNGYKLEDTQVKTFRQLESTMYITAPKFI